MTVEEAVKELNVIKHCEVDSRKQIEAIDIVVAALREEKIGGTLTLEQLRGMRGRPVLLETGEVSIREQLVSCFEILVDCKESWFEFTRRKRMFHEKNYGITWLAYAYPPAHIDWESWEPCGECAPSCSWCKNNNESSKGIPKVCKECNHYSNYVPEYKFCCECGRPLTQEAREELRKRILGE